MPDDAEFDRALVAAAFSMAASDGWRRVSVVEAARRAGLPLAAARARFPGRGAVLLRFGRLADQEALGDIPPDPAIPPRERLFELLMRRFDALQAQREGVIAVLTALPSQPQTALLLTLASLRSMAWMLEAAGISAQGPLGDLRANGLLAVWLQTVRAWRRDDSADLSGTMAALDAALRRAERLASWLPGGNRMEAPPAPPASPPQTPSPPAPSPQAPSPPVPPPPTLPPVGPDVPGPESPPV